MFDCFEMFDKELTAAQYTMFNDQLANVYGLTKAIAIQKVHYAVRAIKNEEESYGGDWHFRNGRWWANRSYAYWHSLMPYIDLKTVKRTFMALRDDGVLVSCDGYNEDPADKTLWWAVDYIKVFSDTQTNVLGTKCPQGGRDKMTPSINIYNIYIDIEKEYKVKEYKESTHVDQSTTLRFLRNLGVLDRSKLLALLAFNFSVYTSYCGSAHPKLPDTAGTVELLTALLGMIHDNGMDEAMQDYVTFLEADWVNGDKHLWLFCSEKVQAWLTASKTGDYECWNIATDRVASL